MGKGTDVGYLLQLLRGADDALELIEEPAVDLRQCVDLFDTVAST